MRLFGKALRDSLTAYESGLNSIVSTGRITREDANVIARVGLRLGLTEKDTLPVRLNASRALFDFEVRNQIWRDHDGALDSLPRLGLNGTTDANLVAAYHANRASRLMHYLETMGRADPLVAPTSAIIVEPGEAEALTLAASLHEERVTGTLSFGITSSHFSGNGHGVDEYGRSLSSTNILRDIVQVSNGHIHLTDRRLVFTGTPKAAGLYWRDLNGVNSANGVLCLYVKGSSQTLILKPDRPEYCRYAHQLILHYAHGAQHRER